MWSMLTTSRELKLPSTSKIRLATILLIGALGLSACSQMESPDQAAQAYGQALSSTKLEALETTVLTDGSAEPEDIVEALAELEQYPRTVQFESAVISEEDEHKATAEYTVTWLLTPGESSARETSEDGEQDQESGDATWSYSSQATLNWDESSGTWLPLLEAETLLPRLGENGKVTVHREPAQRANILDAHGYPLATQRDVRRIGIDKMHVAQSVTVDGVEPSENELTTTLTTSATQLAEALELDAEPLIERVLAAGEKAWVEFIVLRDTSESEIPLDSIETIPGAAALHDTMILAPTPTFARSILGTYGLPTAEDIEQSKGTMHANVATGLSGLQLTHNTQLAGLDGLNIVIEKGQTTSTDDDVEQHTEFSRPATDGEALETTIDFAVQELAEQTIGESDVLSSLVVVRPSDGHILAAAEGPDETSWPVALTGAYAPGSTFKIVTALAMLRNGMTPDSTVSCPASMVIDSTEISNYDEYPASFEGEISLADAVAQSCNTVFVGQWEDISPQEIQQAAQDLGIVEEPHVGFDGAFLGSVPTDVAGAQHASGLFGQGVVQTSPLGMATVAASVAAGHTVKPVLVQNTDQDAQATSQGTNDSGLTQEEAEMLQELMAGPVETGTVPVLQQVPGDQVLAKTGTAQFVDDGENKAHTWIMASQGDIAVSLFYHEGVAGAQTNGPVLQEFLTELNDVLPNT